MELEQAGPSDSSLSFPSDVGQQLTPAVISSVARELNSLIHRETAKTRLRRLAVGSRPRSKLINQTAKSVPFNPVCARTTVEACKAVRAECSKVIPLLIATKTVHC